MIFVKIYIYILILNVFAETFMILMANLGYDSSADVDSDALKDIPEDPDAVNYLGILTIITPVIHIISLARSVAAIVKAITKK